jgi:hypothetical protein
MSHRKLLRGGFLELAGHLLLATSCFLAMRRIPWRPPSDATRRPPPSSFPWRPPSSPCFLPVTCKQRHGRHLAPLIPCSSLLPDGLRRSLTPPSSSSPKESTGTAGSHRRFARFPRRSRARRCQNPPPPARLWPNQLRRSVPSEFPVRMGPSPASLMPRRRRRWAGRLSARHDRGQLTRSAWPADVGLGPLGQWPWVKLTPVQKVCTPYFISRFILENNKNLQNA